MQMAEEGRSSLAWHETSVIESAANGASAVASGPETRTSRSFGAFHAIKRYFEERMDTEGVDDTDGQLALLAKLLFTKRQVYFMTDELRETQVAVRILGARRAYADHHDLPMPQVTKRTLQESADGLDFWMNQEFDEPYVDASELVVPVVSDYEVLKRIYDVLREREIWLEEQGLDVKTVMDYEQGGRFLTWAQERFAQMEDEKFRDDANRYSGKSEYQVKQARRARFESRAPLQVPKAMKS